MEEQEEYESEVCGLNYAGYLPNLMIHQLFARNMPVLEDQKGGQKKQARRWVGPAILLALLHL